MIVSGALLLAGWIAGTISGAVGFGGAVFLLPILTFTVGVRAAVPILTVAQLLGNLSRAGLGWRDIRWRPVFLYSAGAVPAAVVGSRLFVELPPGFVGRFIGVFLLVVIVWRHTRSGERPVPNILLVPVGAGAGFLSAVAGSAGPIGAAAFLSLHLTARAYIASEAVTAVLMHLAKSVTYRRYGALTMGEIQHGLALGAALVLGSWTGRELIDRLQQKEFTLLVEALLAASAILLISGWG